MRAAASVRWRSLARASETRISSLSPEVRSVKSNGRYFNGSQVRKLGIQEVARRGTIVNSNVAVRGLAIG
jgi:hypothetical protein